MKVNKSALRDAREFLLGMVSEAENDGARWDERDQMMRSINAIDRLLGYRQTFSEAEIKSAHYDPPEPTPEQRARAQEVLSHGLDGLFRAVYADGVKDV